ncbi:Serine/threonine-protein kinase PrkC [Gemmata sp. SH-PL17]|uniref:serine/threonine-protein kinase n=1 Tax=Gemmata sp. SH-PL17 TaxID=1630693 RepID=UPI0004B97252|nr:serine/threonine-protein kinase [Gemmata sp. SH-PL17]AMV29122.1 Serine/threonine-protein kinase PrkC [Gemmata sp. SH-PL17]
MPATVKNARLPSVPRYEFGAAIGSGGMGTVYRALDRTTKGLVAIKVLRTKISENHSVHQRLFQEFRAATQLEHPNIVRALDIGIDGSISYLVYELVEGANLGDRIVAAGKIPEAEAVRVITQVAQALHYAHLHQVVHRDIKPDNILVLPDGRAKLTDFGLAKDYNNDLDLTSHASALGTPNFMAPEQFGNAKTADARCDVYALGATLYNAVTGKLPFHAKFPLAILARKEKETLSARSVVPELSERVDAAIRSALHVDPDQRPQSCLEFFKLLTTRSKFEADVPDLSTLQYKKTAGPSDRRGCIRHALDMGTCGVIDTSATGTGNPESEEMWPLVVRDVSTSGLGVLLARRFELGTELTIEFLTGESEVARLEVRVVRIEPEKAGHWIHGCVFKTNLSDDELEDLIKFA